MNVFQLAAGVMLTLVGVWLLFDAREAIRLGFSSYSWPRVEGLIIDSSDKSFTLPGIDQTSAGVKSVGYKEVSHVYRYCVGNQTYYGDKFCFGGWAENATAAYHTGTVVPVYYDPRRPQMAVLRRGLQPSAVFGVLPLAGGLTMFFFSL